MALFLYGMFIFVLSVIPVSLPEEAEVLPIDKLAHFLLYMGFAFLLKRSISHIKHGYLLVFLVGFVWGVLMEIVQFFLPYRSFQIQDIITNGIGLVTGICVSYVLREERLL